jgi:membrane protease YdiL (CAAX protease family)
VTAGEQRWPRARVWVGWFLRLVVGIAIVIASVVAAVKILEYFVPLSVAGGDPLKRSLLDLAEKVIIAIIAVALYLQFCRLTEIRDPGLFGGRRKWGELGFGVFLGALLLSCTVATLWALGMYQVQSSVVVSQWPLIIVNGLAIAAQAAILEELLVRGIILRLLCERFGDIAALVISALLFGALHLANPHSSLLIAAGLAAQAGVLLGAAYLLTRHLWLPIGLHFAWNFGQATVYGGALSGTTTHAIISAKLTDPTWLSGGEFGVEGSVFATLFCLIAAMILLWRYARKLNR